MKTVDNYLDTYGFSGWKSSLQPPYVSSDSALAAMLRDEIASAGSTELSKFSRAALIILAAELPATAYSDIDIKTPLTYLKFDSENFPDSTVSPNDSVETILLDADARYKQVSVLLLRGDVDNPFRQYDDVLKADGTVVLDTTGTVNIEQLTAFYIGSQSYVTLGEDITTRSSVITSKAIFANLLSTAVEYGVATASQMQQTFGNYMPDVVSTALAQIDNADKLPPLAALSDANAEMAFKAYLAYFGRPPDTGGLTSWVNFLNQPGFSIDNLIETFGSSAESIAIYGNASSGSKVDAIYHYLFNRDPDAAGRDFWVGAIDNGDLSMAGAALNILNGARDDATLGTHDLTIVNEKIDAARAFVASLDTQREIDLYVGNDAALSARKYLSAITASESVNNNVIGIVGQVINALQGDVDSIFTVHGITLGYY